MITWRSTAAAALFASLAVSLSAQGLGEIAKRAEALRKANSRPSVTLDERDVNPVAARRDFLQFRLDDTRWRRFLAADLRMADIVRRGDGFLDRLEALNYTSLRSVGHFLRSDSAAASALAAAGIDPHEYAYTYLATKLALSDDPDALADVVQQNAAFVKSRAAETRTLAIPLSKLSLHMLRASSAPAAPAVAPPPAPRASSRPAPVSPSTVRPADSGVIDLSAGSEIPDFEFVDFEGRRRSLAEFRGRHVMLDFWGSWCPPCRAELPFVKDAYARFGSRGFEVLGLDSERGATVDEVRRYLTANGVRWSFATSDSVRSLINDRFQISTFPRVVLIGPDGRVVEASNKALRGEQLGRTLDRLLPR